MSTADGLIRWYFAAGDDLGAPAMDPVKARGLYYATRTCRETIKRKGTERVCGSSLINWNAEGLPVCGYCGAPRKRTERFQLRGEVQETPRNDGFERAVFDWALIGKLLNDFYRDEAWQWAARAYIANARGSSIRDIVMEGTVEFPDAPFAWTFHRGRELVNAGREEWTRRLFRAGIQFDSY